MRKNALNQNRTGPSIIDTTLRDGHQCLWATRMSTPMMLPVLEEMDQAGFQAIELVGAVQFDSCVRFLGENPWERMRTFAKTITRTKRQAIIRSRCALGFGPERFDVCTLLVDLFVKNGIERVIGFDGLHDISNLEPSLLRAKELGVETGGWLIFCDSPIHTDEYYVGKAREFIDRCGVGELMIEDTSGILTPERARTLIPAIREEIGDMPLGLHTHNLLGMAQRTYMVAAEHGIDQLYCCVSPISDGNAPPSVHTTARNLHYLGFEPGLDMAMLDRTSRYLHALAEHVDKPKGQIQDYNPLNFSHQIPGGVLSNLGSQLDAAGCGDKLEEVLVECGRIREELGWPIMVTPFSQFVSVQATLNVISGERYGTVPDEVKQYVLGYFGELPGAVDPEIRKKILQNGSPKIADKRPEETPVLPGLRAHYPDADDEEIMLRRSFPKQLVEAMMSAEPDRTDYSDLDKPVLRLMREVAARPDLRSVTLERGDFRFEIKR